MPTATPAEKSVVLFNELVALPPAEVERIAQIEWQARTLFRRSPSDDVAGLALLETLSLLGKAAEALQVAESIWHRVRFADANLRQIFAGQLANIARYDRASELFLRLLDEQPINSLLSGLVHTAWGTGDANMVRRCVEALPGGPMQTLTTFLDQLRLSGLDTHWKEHRRIINQHVLGKQTYVQIVASPEDGYVAVAEYIYVAATHRERLELEETIIGALDDYYGRLGLGDSPYLAFMVPVILNVTAAPPHMPASQSPQLAS